MALGTFVFEPPGVNPACVESELNFGRAAQLGVLCGALLAAFLDKALQLCPWLRAEKLCFGWKCCSRCAAGRAARRFCWSTATPFLRYFLGTGLTVVYVRVMRVAIGAVDCSESAELNGALALDADAAVPCFVASHALLAALALSTLVLVGVAWPIASVLFLAQRLARPPIPMCAPPRCLVARCDAVQKAMPAGWVQVYDVDANAMVFAHLESGARLAERPLGDDAWQSAVRAAVARSDAEPGAEAKERGSKGGDAGNDDDADCVAANAAGAADGDDDDAAVPAGATGAGVEPSPREEVQGVFFYLPLHFTRIMLTI